jgi:hypothetical protein
MKFMVLIAPKHEPGDHAGQSGGDYTDARIESNGAPEHMDESNGLRRFAGWKSAVHAPLRTASFQPAWTQGSSRARQNAVISS